MLALYAEKERLRAELDVSHSPDVIALVRSLEAQLTAFSEPDSPAETKKHRVSENSAVLRLNRTVHALDTQLACLFDETEVQVARLAAEREILAFETDHSDAALVRTLLARMETQLHTLALPLFSSSIIPENAPPENDSHLLYTQIQSQINALHEEHEQIRNTLEIPQSEAIGHSLNRLGSHLDSLQQIEGQIASLRVSLSLTV